MKLRQLVLNSFLGVLTLSSAAAMMTSSLMPVLAVPAEKSTSSGLVDPGFGSGEGKITIKCPENQKLTGRKFHLFQILLASGTGENVAYSIPDDTVRQALKAALQQAGQGSDLDNDGKIIKAIENLGLQDKEPEKPSNENFRKFITALKGSLSEQAIAISVLDETGENSVEISPVPVGYYLLDEITEDIPADNPSSLCMITTAAPEVEIILKSEKTDLGMEGEDEDGKPSPGDPDQLHKDIVDLQIGEKVTFTTTLSLPEPGTYASYPLTFSDTIAKELTFNPESDAITVKIGETPLAKETDYSISLKSGSSEEERVFEIQFSDIASKITDASENLTISFEAVLNEKAAENLAGGYKNTMVATYPVDPDNPATNKTATTSTTVYTYGLEGLKTDMSSSPLAGAEFALYEDASGDQEIKLAKSSDKLVPSKTGSEKIVSADETGKFNLYGLDAGTYYLKESKAPDGFYPIEGMIELKVTPTYDQTGLTQLKGTAKYLDPESNTASDNELTGSKDNNLVNLAIKNKQGGLLPSTGSSMMLIGLAGLAGLLAASFYLSREKKDGQAKGKKSLSFDCTIEPIDCTKEEMLQFLQEKAQKEAKDKEQDALPGGIPEPEEGEETKEIEIRAQDPGLSRKEQSQEE